MANYSGIWRLFTKFLSCAVLKETAMERVDWHPVDLVSFPPSKSGKYSAHRVSQKHRPCISMLEHMAKSQHELANILEAKRFVVAHMAMMVKQIPDKDPSFGEIKPLMGYSLDTTKGIATYLNSLADLEDALADNIAPILVMMKEELSDE